MTSFIDTLESRRLLSSTPAAVTTLLADSRTMLADVRTVQRVDAAAMTQLAAAIRTNKLTKTDAVALAKLRRDDASALRALSAAGARANTVLASSTAQVLAAARALALRPTNGRLAALLETRLNTLSSNAAAELSVLNTDIATLQTKDFADLDTLGGPMSENLVVDGDFEDPSVGSGGSPEGYPGSGLLLFYTSGPVNNANVPSSGSTFGGAWQVASGSVDVNAANYFTAYQGAQSVDLDGINPGTLYQDIPTTPGQQYVLTFAFAGNPTGGASIKQMQVTAGSVSQQYSFDITGKSPTNMGWTTQSVSFTASGSTTRIQFASLDDASSVQGPALDDVTVTPTSSSSQSALNTATSDYHTRLANALQTLGTDATTALSTDVSAVVALYSPAPG